MRFTEEQVKALFGNKVRLVDKEPRKSRRAGRTAIYGGYKSNVQGWREVGGKRCYFRSLWEIQFCQYLQWLKKQKDLLDWFYEPELFKFPKEEYNAGPFQYLPDFKTIRKDGNEIWYEVKGYMDKKSTKKLKRFKKHFPNHVIEIIDSEWFKQARKNNIHILAGFEQMPL